MVCCIFLPPAVPPGCRQVRLLLWTAGGKGQPAWSLGLDRGRGDHLSTKTVDMNGPFRLRFASTPGYLKLTVDAHQLYCVVYSLCRVPESPSMSTEDTQTHGQP